MYVWRSNKKDPRSKMHVCMHACMHICQHIRSNMLKRRSNVDTIYNNNPPCPHPNNIVHAAFLKNTMPTKLAIKKFVLSKIAATIKDQKQKQCDKKDQTCWRKNPIFTTSITTTLRLIRSNMLKKRSNADTIYNNNSPTCLHESVCESYANCMWFTYD